MTVMTCRQQYPVHFMPLSNLIGHEVVTVTRMPDRMFLRLSSYLISRPGLAVVIRPKPILAPYEAFRAVAQIDEVEIRAAGLSGGAIEPGKSIRGRKFFAFLGLFVQLFGTGAHRLNRAG